MASQQTSPIPFGWKVDSDGWLTRLLGRNEPAPVIAETAGFVHAGAVTVRTVAMAEAVNYGRPIPDDWSEVGDWYRGWPGEPGGPRIPFLARLAAKIKGEG